MAMAMANLLLPLLALCLALFRPAQSAAHTCPEDITASSLFKPESCLETPDMYSKVMDPTLSASHLQDLPGFTRSVYERDHALITPESQVFSPLPGWFNTLAAYLITPAMGAHFTMYLASMAGNSSSAPPPLGVERFVFLVKGEASLTAAKPVGRIILQVDWYAYIPPNMEHTLSTGATSANLLIIERRYLKGGDGVPEFITGRTSVQTLLTTPGEVFDLRKLLPATSVYDFNIHVMDFQPGEFLNVKEVHYNQHGLLLLEGRGIYRLGDKWYPVQAGDVIWMAPFVPQWYAALGKTRSRYILYKDTSRDPLLHPY